jgi:hypothetical protein
VPGSSGLVDQRQRHGNSARDKSRNASDERGAPEPLHPHPGWLLGESGSARRLMLKRVLNRRRALTPKVFWRDVVRFSRFRSIRAGRGPKGHELLAGTKPIARQLDDVVFLIWAWLGGPTAVRAILLFSASVPRFHGFAELSRRLNSMPSGIRASITLEFVQVCLN